MQAPKILTLLHRNHRLGIGVRYDCGDGKGELFFHYDQKPSYSRVKLKTGVLNSFTSKLTGLTEGWFEWSQRDCNLQEARIIMCELEPQTGLLNETDRLLFNDLLQATQVDGVPPQLDDAG